MEIVNFFEKMAGRWFSQRTTHALSSQQSKAGKSDLEVSFLAADAPEVQQLCEQLAQETSQQTAQPLCGLQVQQSSTVEGDTRPTVRTTLLVPLSSSESGSESGLERDSKSSSDAPEKTTGAVAGPILRSGSVGASPQQGTYNLDEEVLTISTETKDAQSTERLWFINDNLRMRTGITELESGLRIASFCSEIRMGAKPPKTE